MDLSGYLRSVGLSARPGETGGLIVRRVRRAPTKSVRPAGDFLAMAAPLRPLTIETRVKGRIVRNVLRQGDICLQPPMVALEMRFGTTDMIAASVPTQLIVAAATALTPGDNRSPTFRLVHKTRDVLLSSLAVELCNEIDLGAPSGQFYSELLGIALLARIIKRYGARPSETLPWGPAGEDARISRALAYVKTRLTQDFSLADIARHVGMSPAHLSQVFKSATGETIWSHVRRRRLERARDLLLRTKFTVADVAEKVGYASTPRFTQAFKAAFGVSPGVYRKSMRS
jgi:AraC-like DNA-binding protein